MKLNKNIYLIVSTTFLLSACSILSSKPEVEGVDIPETEVMVPEILLPFKEGDTLWDFAERTTGSGFNWEQLKIVNEIEDETDIDAGTMISVPQELALETLKSE